MTATFPTTDDGLNALLYDLVSSAQSILGDNFLAAYLQGSFAVGDWDADSDVDFLIALDHDVPETHLAALQEMHARLYQRNSPWATHLEGAYFPKEILRRRGSTATALLYIDNGSQALIRSAHDDTRVVRWVAREFGITLAGSAPDRLIDPVSADELREEVRATMREWGDDTFSGRYSIGNRWAQPFAVLSYCRMLHTLETGRVGSKPAGAEWAKRALDSQWVGLIERAWAERPNPPVKVRQQADQQDVENTLAFIRYALAYSGQ